MSNRFQVLLKDKEGVELDTWLRQKSKVFPNQSNLESLNNMRIFYIVKAAFEADTNVYKIGISERGEHAAKGRLIDYTYYYGTADKKNDCKGVKIYLVLANRFNPDVTIANSFVRKLETRVKDQFKEARDRGAERLDVPIEELFEYLEETTNLDGDDTEIETRKTPRLREKGQAARDAVKSILETVTDRKGNVKYKVEFSEIAFKYNEDDNQRKSRRGNEILTYEQIVQLPRGKQLLDEYIKKASPTTTTSRSGVRTTNLTTNNSRAESPTPVRRSSRISGNARVTSI
jgi:hypothetical protein